MIPYTVASKHIDIKRREVPYLDNSQRRQHICHKRPTRNEPGFKGMYNLVISSSHIHEDKVIDKLDVLDFFLGVFDFDIFHC